MITKNENNVIEEVKGTVGVATSNEKSNNVSNMTELEELMSDLQNKREGLSSYNGKSATVHKTMERKIRKAEKALKEYLEKQELPTLPVEFWEEEKSDPERVSYRKIKQEIIIATTVYNMEAKKATVEKGKALLDDGRLENTATCVSPAQLFYDNEVELKDLNGNIIPKGTENVYVLLSMANTYWLPLAYHNANIYGTIKGDPLKTVKNVQIREFKSLQEYGQYEGINNMLSRGLSGTEKAGLAALATTNEFLERVFKESNLRKMPISTATKYFNEGRTIKQQVWNEAMLGNMPTEFKYDLSIGESILNTLNEMKFSDKVKKERSLIDAFSQLRKYNDPAVQAEVGFDKTMQALKALTAQEVEYINELTVDKQTTIHNLLYRKYLNICPSKGTAA